MDQEEVEKNIFNGINNAVTKFQNQIDDIYNIHIKISDSVSIPIYNSINNDEIHKYIDKKSSTTDNVKLNKNKKMRMKENANEKKQTEDVKPTMVSIDDINTIIQEGKDVIKEKKEKDQVKFNKQKNVLAEEEVKTKVNEVKTKGKALQVKKVEKVEKGIKKIF